MKKLQQLIRGFRPNCPHCITGKLKIYLYDIEYGFLVWKCDTCKKQSM